MLNIFRVIMYAELHYVYHICDMCMICYKLMALSPPSVYDHLHTLYIRVYLLLLLLLYLIFNHFVHVYMLNYIMYICIYIYDMCMIFNK